MIRKSIPGSSIWYNANGPEWGYVGPNGERLDQEGNPKVDRPSRGLLRPLLWLLAACLIVGALMAADMRYSSSRDLPGASVPHPSSAPRCW